MASIETAPAAPMSDGAAALKDEAGAYLRSLLGKHLIIHTGDRRMFRGEFMCTDPDCNIVLAHADEYREPTARQVAEQAKQAELKGGAGKVVVNMVSRYLGLIVVPGKHIARIEIEQFTSQMRK